MTAKLIVSAGQLPFLTHLHHTISSLPSIFKYVSAQHLFDTTRSPNLDAVLSTSEKAQQVAWCAHVESNLGNLVVCLLCLCLFRLIDVTTGTHVLLPELKLVRTHIANLSKHALHSAAVLCASSVAGIVQTAPGSCRTLEFTCD